MIKTKTKLELNNNWKSKTKNKSKRKSHWLVICLRVKGNLVTYYKFVDKFVKLR